MRASGQAAVIDPRRDVDIYLDEVARRGLHIGHVLETHVHNDYVSGARELAALTGATHVIGAAAELATPFRPVRDGQAIDVGQPPSDRAGDARSHPGARQLRRP